jgi:hypothetical protein
MNQIESDLLEIADALTEREMAQKIHAVIERLRLWREQDAKRQHEKRARYTDAMMVYVNAAREDSEEDNEARARRDRERIARIVATDSRWTGTYAALCDLLAS